MQSRIELFRSRCAEHLIYRRLAKRLDEQEFDRIVEFLEDNEDLNHEQFEQAVNRMYLHQPKTKCWAVVQELLSMTNTAARGRNYAR